MNGQARAVACTAGRTAVALLSVAVLVTTGYGWSVAGDLRGLDDRIAISDAVPGAIAQPAEAVFTALLVGLDARTDTEGMPLLPEVLEMLHAGDDDGQLNTDTIILLHVPKGPAPQAVAISFPRDSYVEIAGDRGTHKINTAYRRGLADAEDAARGRDLLPAERDQRAREAGRRALVATVAELSGVTVDHFAEINLAGFVEITDALGGVPVCLNAAVQESRSGIDLPAGRQVVQGPEALAFVRQRRGLDAGDIDRISRQQAFLAGLTSSVLTGGALRDPDRLDALGRAVGRHVVLDRGWSVRELVGQLRRVGDGDLRFVTIPTGTLGLQTRGDGIAVEVDPDEVRRFVRAHIPLQPMSPLLPGSTPAPPTANALPTTTPTPSQTTAGSTTDPATATTSGSGSTARGAPTTPGSEATVRTVPGTRTSGGAVSTTPSPAVGSTGGTRSTSVPQSTTSSAASTAPTITADGVPCVD